VAEFNYRYSEGQSLKEIIEYINSTYEQHYVNKDKSQLLDLFADEENEYFSKINASKYIARFGKKEGKNKKDLLKAVHYIVLMMHFSGVMNETHNGKDESVNTNNGRSREHTAKRRRSQARQSL
jgi:hypothetical protein